MGVTESKLITKKFEKRIIKCPIETTEIIASDCGSIQNVGDLHRPESMSMSNFNGNLSSHISIENLSNLSIVKSDWSINNSIDNISCPASRNDKSNIEISHNSPGNINCKETKDYSIKPKIQKLNSKIELLNDSLSDEILTSDEFTTSEESDSDSNKTPSSDDSNDTSDEENSNFSNETSKSCEINDCKPTCQQISFNKNFIQNLKNRYSSKYNCENKSFDKKSLLNSMNSNGDESNSKHNFELDDSFTEITKVLPSNSKHCHDNCSKDDVKYLQNFILNRIKENNNGSVNSLENSSLKTSNIFANNKHNSNPNSKIEFSNISGGNLKRNSHSSLDNRDVLGNQLGLRSLCYKFWVDATFDTWKVFHNPRDRRIESIGRMSNCQIRLTKITQRSTKGMLKRQVFVYASNLSGLKKCCKLFDDKFPQFCASAGLTFDNSGKS